MRNIVNLTSLKEPFSFSIERRNYLKHAPCLNQVTRSPKACVRSLKMALEIVPRLEWDKRIPAGCCAYRQFLHCTEKLIEQKCGKEAIEFFSCKYITIIE